MKRTALFFFIVILTSSLSNLFDSAGHTSVMQERPRDESTESETKAPLTNRKNLALEEALQGHWITEGSTHYYYDGGDFISVYGGKINIGQYTVEETDEEKRTMRIRIKGPHCRILTFSADKNEVSDVMEFNGVRDKKAFIWKFVGSTRKPTLEILKSTQSQPPTLDIVTREPVPETVVGDPKTKTYYWRGCPKYEEARRKDWIYFDTQKHAEKAGYRPANECK
jgi:hypothetical protein